MLLAFDKTNCLKFVSLTTNLPEGGSEQGMGEVDEGD